MRKSKIDPALIQELIDQGRSDLEIANRLGCTVGTLRVRCSQLKLSLRRPAKVVLPQAILDQLNQRAELMGVSTTTLAADLLEEIARDDLYDAVLDRDDTKVNPAIDGEPQASQLSRSRPRSPITGRNFSRGCDACPRQGNTGSSIR